MYNLLTLLAFIWLRCEIALAPKDSMISKGKWLFSVFPGGCLPWILVYKPEIDSDVFTGATFHKENDPEKGNEILV